MWTLEILINYSWGVDFPCGSAGKESTCNVGDLGSIHGLGRSPSQEKGKGKGEGRRERVHHILAWRVPWTV